MQPFALALTPFFRYIVVYLTGSTGEECACQGVCKPMEGLNRQSLPPSVFIEMRKLADLGRFA